MRKATSSTTKSTPEISRETNRRPSKLTASAIPKFAESSSMVVNSSPSTSTSLGQKNGIIDEYFARVIKSQASALPPKAPHAPSSSSQTAWLPSKENAYTPLRIREIKSGPGRISFRGRIANAIEHDLKLQKASGASKRRWILAVADGTGIIEVRFYLRDPHSLRTTPKLGGLVRIYTTFVGPLSPKDKERGSASTAEVFVSISDTDKDSNVEFIDDNDESYADYRNPLGVQANGGLPGVIPLRVFVESNDENLGAKLLVGVKWKGPLKRIARADITKGSFEKREIGIFDDTMECTLSLFGSAHESARTWNIVDTVILIEKPSLHIYQQIVEIRLNRNSIVTVNPLIRCASYLRSYGTALIRKNNIAQPFPDELFDAEKTLRAENVWKYTLGDIDKFSREADVNRELIGPCTGILNAVITEMNITSLWNKNMLLCKSCCGVVLYSSKIPVTCERCDEVHYDMIPNPEIIGRISDETGSVAGRNLLVSQSAWEELLGVPVGELWKKSRQYFRDVDSHCLYLRRNFVFGWELEIGKLTIMGIREA